MASETEHGRILTRSAKEALAPLGCRRKGRSRVWYADQLFWVIHIEFQPSGFGRGSYLNVAPMWLWCEKESWSFDFGNVRIADFIQFEDTKQFERDANVTAAKAAHEVVRLRELFSASSAVVTHLSKAADTGHVWQRYHAAVANGLAGNTDRAIDLFARIQELRGAPAWVSKLQDECAELVDRLRDRQAFHSAVSSIIGRTRALHGLPEKSDYLRGW